MNLPALLLAAAAAAAPAARTYRNPIIDRVGPADPHVIHVRLSRGTDEPAPQAARPSGGRR